MLFRMATCLLGTRTKLIYDTVLHYRTQTTVYRSEQIPRLAAQFVFIVVILYILRVLYQRAQQ